MTLEPGSVVTRYWMPAIIAASGTVVAAVAAVFAASALNGGGNEAPQPTNVVLVTGTPSPSPADTVVLTDVPTPSPTAEGNAPPNSIVAGEWDFRYTVISNTCPFGTPENGRIDYPLEITEGQFGDGYIEEGEDAAISDQGNYLGKIELTYPDFTFNYPISVSGYNGTAQVSITFNDAESGFGYRKDTYTDAQGSTCSIIAEDH